MDWTPSSRYAGYKRLYSTRDTSSTNVRRYGRLVKRRITGRWLGRGVKRFSQGAASAARRFRLAGARAGAAYAGSSATAVSESEGLLEGIEMSTYGAEAMEGTAVAGEVAELEGAAASLGPLAAAVAAVGLASWFLWRHFHKKHKSNDDTEDNTPDDPSPEDNTQSFIGVYPPLAVAYATNRRSPYTDGAI